MTAPRVSILIVNMNGGRLLRACLDSLQQQQFQDFEVIVVDNGSTDGSWDLPEFQGNPRYTLIRLDRNSGFSEANNLAYAQAKGAYVVLLNNDVELHESWLANMVKAAEPEDVGSVACQLRQKNAPHLLDSVGFKLFFNGSTESAHGIPWENFYHKGHQPFGAVASAALYKRSAIEALGVLFHPEYFAYYEDTDLAIRLKLFGYKTAYAHEAIGWHVGSATGQKRSGFHGYHLRRNIEYLFWVDFSAAHILRYVWAHFLSETAAFFDLLFRGKPWVFIRAKRDAFGGVAWMRRQRRALWDNVNTHLRRQAEQGVLGLIAYAQHKIRYAKHFKVEK